MRRATQPPRRAAPLLRIRVDLTPDCSIGPGKVALLEAIAREGSLSVAARSIDMSYRRAWNLLDDLNRSFAQTVVATAVGGTQGGGARLTNFGRALVKAFRALEDAALPLARTHLRRFSATASKRRTVARRRPITGRLRASSP
jgi:molybdate transport system regulatory protein